MKTAPIGVLALALLAASPAHATQQAKWSHNNTIITSIGWETQATIAIEAEVPGYPRVTPGALVGGYRLACSHEEVDHPSFSSGRVFMECAGRFPEGLRTRVCVYVEEAFPIKAKRWRITPKQARQIVSDARCMTLEAD